MDEGLAVPMDPSAEPSCVTWVWSPSLPVPSFPKRSPTPDTATQDLPTLVMDLASWASPSV